MTALRRVLRARRRVGRHRTGTPWTLTPACDPWADQPLWPTAGLDVPLYAPTVLLPVVRSGGASC